MAQLHRQPTVHRLIAYACAQRMAHPSCSASGSAIARIRRVRSEVAVRALVRTAGGPPPAAASPGGGRAGLHTVWLRPAAAGPEAPGGPAVRTSVLTATSERTRL